ARGARIVEPPYQPYEVYYPRSDWAEQDPEELWQAVAATTREVIQKSGIDPGDVAGVGVSAQMFNLLPVDKDCRPVTRMLSWLDVRSVQHADRQGRGAEDPVAQGGAPRPVGAHPLAAGLQGVHPLQADRRSGHRLARG